MKFLISIISIWLLLLGCGEIFPQGAKGRASFGEGKPEVEREVEQGLTYYKDIRPLMTKACISCHGEIPAENAPLHFNLSRYEDISGIKGVAAVLDQLKLSMTNKTMPPPESGGEWLESDTLKVLDWIETGAVAGDKPALLDPVVSFKSPSSSGVVANSQATIEVEIANLLETETWDLYFSKTKGATTNGSLIKKDNASTTKKVVWNSSDKPIGTYYFYVIIKRGDIVYSKSSTGAVEIIRAPIISLTTHNGEKVYLNTDIQNISWTVTDTDGFNLNYKVEYSDDGGASYVPLVTNLAANIRSYAWDISNITTYVRGAQYKVKVTAIDTDTSEDLPGAKQSQKNFAISPSAITYYQDVLPVFTAAGCGTCHDGTGRNVAQFDMSVYVDGNANNAFKLQDSLASDVLLGAAGTMTLKPGVTFSASNFDLVKMWKWNGALQGEAPE